MPTASLMIYVMGLEAAKSRPATCAEQKEMQRLLHEGMDAGLCGFSIQRLGPNSTQADFDGSPMVTDTMCDDDIFCLAEVLRERDEGFIQLTQATGAPTDPDDLEFKRRLAEVAQRPIIDNVVPVSQNDPAIHRGRLEWLAAGPPRRPADLRPGRHASAPGSPSPSTTGTSTTPARPGVKPPPAPRGEDRQDARPRAAGAHQGGDRRRRPRCSPRRRAASVARPASSSCRASPAGADMQQYVGRTLEAIAQDEGKHYLDVMLDLSLMTDLRTEFLGDPASNIVEHMAGCSTTRPTPFPACPTAAPTPSSSTAARGPPTS